MRWRSGGGSAGSAGCRIYHPLCSRPSPALRPLAGRPLACPLAPFALPSSPPPPPVLSLGFSFPLTALPPRVLLVCLGPPLPLTLCCGLLRPLVPAAGSRPVLPLSTSVAPLLLLVPACSVVPRLSVARVVSLSPSSVPPCLLRLLRPPALRSRSGLARPSLPSALSSPRPPSPFCFFCRSARCLRRAPVPPPFSGASPSFPAPDASSLLLVSVFLPVVRLRSARLRPSAVFP